MKTFFQRALAALALFGLLASPVSAQRAGFPGFVGSPPAVSSAVYVPPQIAFTVSGSFTVTTQTSISCVAIGRGGNSAGQDFSGQFLASSGAGGEWRYINAVSVATGDVITVTVANYDSGFTTISKNGTTVIRAQAANYSSPGNSGTGGVAFSGGQGSGQLADYGAGAAASGGGVSGQDGSPGSDNGGPGLTLLAGGSSASGSNGAAYGGGGGSSESSGGLGGPGAARCMWTGVDGLTRAYPSTNVSDRL